MIPLKIRRRFLERKRDEAGYKTQPDSRKVWLHNKPGGGEKNKQKNTRRDAWPDFHLMKMISIIHLTAGGLRRQSQQTVTHTVSAKQMTGRLHIIAN